MYEIKYKKKLNPSVTLMDIYAPFVARSARAGQFVILRAEKEGERIPLTVAGYNREVGTVRIIFQTVGATTLKLSALEVGDSLPDFAGPLGNPSELEDVKDALVIGGGVGCAIALPIAEALSEQGARVTSIIGFRSKELLILEEEFSAASDELITVTDDGSYGERGNVCVPLVRLLESGKRFDKIIVIGPLVMMKFVAAAAKPYGIPCVASMNSVMIDGTGMCGGCRLTLERDGKRITRFACVDGPEFNAYEIDFDEAILRSGAYRTFERHAYDEACNLLAKEKGDGK